MEGRSGAVSEARRLEGIIDGKLISYSKFCANFSQETLLSETNSHGDNAWQTMEIEIMSLLRELGEINERISMSLTEADRKHSTAALHAQQHHKGRLREYEKDFRTIRSNVESAKAQAELLSTVRKDISAYKEGGRDDVRLSLDDAQDELSRVLGSAMSNRASLSNQRSTVDESINKLKAATLMLPGVNNLMNKIRRRKARDLIIIAVVISIMIVFLYMFSSRR